MLGCLTVCGDGDGLEIVGQVSLQDDEDGAHDQIGDGQAPNQRILQSGMHFNSENQFVQYAMAELEMIIFTPNPDTFTTIISCIL
jgi:hypothetical protein